MDDQEFQNSAFPILAKEIFESIQATDGKTTPVESGEGAGAP
jgi:hypothetical protein